MLCIFNRKEVCITHDMQVQAEVRDLLQAHHIKYQYRCTSHTSHGRGTLGIRPEAAYLYRIFVHKADYEAATHLLATRRTRW